MMASNYLLTASTVNKTGDFSKNIRRIFCQIIEPVAVAEWTACPLTMWEVSRSNPGNLPLLHMWHVGNVTGHHADLYTVGPCDTRGEFMAHRWQSTQARDPPWLWNPEETSSEVQNRGISSPTKRTHVLQKFFQKKCVKLFWNKNPNIRPQIIGLTR